VGSVGNVDAHLVALLNKAALQFAADAVQHLKLHFARRHSVLVGICACKVDHILVVRRHCCKRAPGTRLRSEACADQCLHGLGYFGPLPIGNRCRFVVCAFAQAKMSHAVGDQRFHIGLRAVQVGLDDKACVVEFFPQAPVHGDGALSVLRALHVDSHEVAQLLRMSDDSADIIETEIIAQVHAHLGQLDRDIGPHSSFGKGIQGNQVLVRGSHGLGRSGNILTQVVQRREHPLIIEVTHCPDRVI